MEMSFGWMKLCMALLSGKDGEVYVSLESEYKLSIYYGTT